MSTAKAYKRPRGDSQTKVSESIKTYSDLLRRVLKYDQAIKLGLVRIDGEPFNEQPIQYQGDPRFDGRFTTQYANRVALATMASELALFGNFVSQPDALGNVTFAYYEQNTFLFSAELLSIEDPSEALRRKITAEVSARIQRLLVDEVTVPKLSDTFFEFVIPWDHASVSYDALAEAIVSAAGDLDQSEASDIQLALVPEKFKLLSSIGARVYMSRRGPAYVGLSYGAHSFDSAWFKPMLLQGILAKATRSYERKPVRLFVYLVDAVLDPSDLNSIRKRLLAQKMPFEQIYAGYGTSVLSLLELPS